ncbi:hypothetical protein PF005_g6600 [Phytophthora fragariae]|uniref:Uncharacterized protein n=2 Tax=Phytophthora TaxID=4783 RepID=A0A6A3T2G0_9STRA|nr:hypothetical protein PF003_g38627 [Phytophthora fragariae]KAE9047526.1 hypothetical protein PR002_g984 [Phytophthora rubi]KAE8944729.1 hypothetical protein PF009_g5595 [Phytophthora fragariae]KAE9019144.1 hypothetical protein PF011_g5954 [Phytophthora fragariae]KAE9051814.1 hypothetical protein PR001_g1096 [Phytophthora rubi]
MRWSAGFGAPQVAAHLVFVCSQVRTSVCHDVAKTMTRCRSPHGPPLTARQVPF